MDHAEVRSWLADAFFRPGALRRLDEGESGDERDARAAAVREHLQDCAACTQELSSLRATSVALDVGFGPSPVAEERMLANVRQLGRQRASPSPSPSPSPSRSPVRAVTPPLRAAAIVVFVLLVFGAGVVVGLGWPAQEPATGPQLAQAARMMGELLQEPDARQLRLVDDAGGPAGLVVHSPARQQLAVLTAALEQPATGRFECYLERDGESVFIGPMNFEDGTAFWAGPVAGPADAGRPGDRFVVMHGPGVEPTLWGQF